MQNLLRFIRKYYHIFLFVILEAIALSSLIRFNIYHEAIFLSTASQASGYVLSKKAKTLSYFSLKKENERLHIQNAARLNDSFNLNFSILGNDTFVIRDSFKEPWFSFIPATVINNSTHQTRNYLTITGGKKNGIRKNMGVISQDGVVGIVVDVSENFALVMSLLHDQFKLKPKIAENNYFGELIWNCEDPVFAHIDKISRHYPIRKGQRVVTSSYSHLFPANVPVGVVFEVKKYVKKPFSDIKVKLATDFGNVQSVYVVKHIYRSEIISLEEQTAESE